MESKTIELAVVCAMLGLFWRQAPLFRPGACRDPILINVSDPLNLDEVKVQVFHTRGVEWQVVIPLQDCYFYGVYQNDNVLFQSNADSCEKIMISRQNITDLIDNPVTDPNTDLTNPQLLDEVQISQVVFKNNIAYNNMIWKVMYGQEINNVMTKNLSIERIGESVQYFLTFLYLRVVRADGTDTIQKFRPQYGRWVKYNTALSYTDVLAIKHYAIYATFDNIENNNNNNGEEDQNIDMAEEDED